MNTDKILLVRREHLLLPLVLCWSVPGIKILATAAHSISDVRAANPDRVGWLCLAAVVVAVVFTLMFNNFVKRYTQRVLTFRERRKSVFAFLDLRGYMIILFMMSLGITLRFIPNMPAEFFAGFYTGLGIALLIAGGRFFVKWLFQMKWNSL